MVIPVYRPFLDEKEMSRVEAVIEDGWISQAGETVRRFEDEVKTFTGVGHGMATDSGTAALHVALESLGIGEGDRVAVPGFTFGATAMAVKQAGATPVPVDVERDTLAMDPDGLEEMVDEVSAVVVAHLFGQPARMDEIIDISEEHGVPVVEDAAQAFGSEYRGEKAGSLGDVGCFSFSWNKTVTAGKGGFVGTDDPEIAGKAEDLADQCGGEGRFDVAKTYNYRMDSVRAAIGLSQLERYREIVERKDAIVETYREELRGAERIEVMEEPGYADVVPWVFYILVENRGEIRDLLAEEGIESEPFYRTIPEMGGFASSRELPVSREVSREGLMLPTYPDMEGSEVERVAETVIDAVDVSGA